MKRTLAGVINRTALIVAGLLAFPVGPAVGQSVEVFGYFESQATGQVIGDDEALLQYNKLRVDLQKRLSEQVFFGANFNFINYNGDRTYNLFWFLPESFDTICPSCPWGRDFSQTYEDTVFLDNAFVQVSHRLADVTIGRQQLSFGTGYAFNPTDIFNTKALLDPTYEQPGRNAVRFDIPLGTAASFTAVWSMEDIANNSTWFARFKWHIPQSHFDLSLMAAALRSDTNIYQQMMFADEKRFLFGGDFEGELFGLGIRGEAAYNDRESSDDYLEALAGCDYTFSFQTYFLLEYYHIGSGRNDKDDYDFNDWLGLLSGNRQTIGRDYLYGFVDHPFHDLVNVGLAGITNFNDGSMMINPQIIWFPFQDVELTVIGSVGIGADGTEYGTFDPSGFIRIRTSF